MSIKFLRAAFFVLVTMAMHVASADAAVQFRAMDSIKHAFFLFGDDNTSPGVRYRWLTSPQALMTFNGTSITDSTSATLTGRIIQVDGDMPNGPAIFDVHMDFIGGFDFTEWTTTQGGDVKNDSGVDQAVVETWTFFNIDPNGTSTITHVGGSGGKNTVTNLIQQFPDLALQVGIGANTFDPIDALGASIWFLHNGSGGDLNIELVPVPTPGTLACLAPGAVVFLARRRRR